MPHGPCEDGMMGGGGWRPGQISPSCRSVIRLDISLASRDQIKQTCHSVALGPWLWFINAPMVLAVSQGSRRKFEQDWSEGSLESRCYVEEKVRVNVEDEENVFRKTSCGI